MQAVVLDGSLPGDERTIEVAALTAACLHEAGFVTETLALREKTIAPCVGCFGCWVRTPGECVNADDSEAIVAKYLSAALVAFVTPVTFGGYSSQLKKALDRTICLLDPRFQTFDGEVHHRKRYPVYPRVVSVGTLPAPDAEATDIFRLLAERQSRNLYGPVDWLVLDSVRDAAEERRDITALLARRAVA